MTATIQSQSVTAPCSLPFHQFQPLKWALTPPTAPPTSPTSRRLAPVSAGSVCLHQALLASQLPFDLLETASAAAQSEDPLAKSWLPKLLHWFHRTFALTTEPVQPGIVQTASGPSNGTSSSSSRDWFVAEFLGMSGAPVHEQLLACVQARSGSSTQLSVLLVALLRAVGFLTRSVW